MEVKLYSRPNKDGKKVLYVDYTEESGRRVRRSLNLQESKANIAYVKRNIIPEIERKIKYGIEFREYKMSEFTDIVLKKAKENKKINTFVTYEKAVNKFYSIMGDVNIEKIFVKNIENYVNSLKREGLSSATINLYLVPIKMAFKEAMRLEIIDKNPVPLADKPIVKNKEKKVFNLIQMHQILEKAEGELKTFLYFAFFTGARPGEIVALRWSDISNNMIFINRTSIQNGKMENLPKGGKKRSFDLLKPLGDYLSTLDKKRDKIFSYKYEAYARSFSRFLVNKGFERNTLHSTRHTFTSLLMKSREDPTLIQYFLGHSSLNMINKVYAHYIHDENDAKRLGNMLAQS